MQDKDFDQLFKERFEAFESKPSDNVWQKITKELDTPIQKKKKTFTSYWMAAASVVLLTSSVLWLNKPDEVIKLQGKSEEQVIVSQTTKTASEVKPVESQIIEEPASKAIVPSQQKGANYLVSVRADKNKVKQVDKTTMFENISPQAAAVKEELVAIQPITIDVPKHQPVVTDEGNEVLMARVDESKLEDYRETDTTNPKIRSVGGLVNFVIAQVDKREDKIIEFRDGDEGSAVSGINLGPLRFKSRNR